METIKRADELIGLTDLDLVQHAYSVVPRIYALDAFDDRGIAAELYFVLDELVERFAPDIAVAEATVRRRGEAKELAGAAGHLERAAGLRKIAAALREGGAGDE